ncbi:MAG: 2-oxoacid:acceptor oxidoreductase subunit alpha [Candidatus Eiseniibacteriota bacterium]|nr:MAG: 2-oxoacid:acceptor oxidoreductase subunit alpha [Candidatus Eisenbacteria bacterium]
MKELSVIIAGKAGDGINQAGLLIARLLARLGYRVYTDIDYPSLIRGGHNFSVVRAARERIGAHREGIDFLLALNQEAIDLHAAKLRDPSRVTFDSDSAKGEGLGLPLTQMVKEEKARPLMRNTCLIGAFAKSAGIDWETFEAVLRQYLPREPELNVKLGRRGYDQARQLVKLEPLEQKELPVLTGNEAVGLGLVRAGLRAYVAYPMTPSSGLLHFLAGAARDFSLKVVHPENEIAVMLMALGISYAGEKVAVGTSGGGFCLMTEGLSLSGMAELPVVVVVGQRPGPSTGLPTYTGQGELLFVLNAGHGEFVRFVVAPGDAEEALYWAEVAMDISWKFQVPSLVLTDKTLAEGGYSLDAGEMAEPPEQLPDLWSGEGPYRRYEVTDTGVSPLAFPPTRGAVVKVNSYEHDEQGITTEESELTAKMQSKRLRKEKHLSEALKAYETVRVFGDAKASRALLCWGSNKGVCTEAGESLGWKVVHVPVLCPLPVSAMRDALKNVEKVVAVENNATGQFVELVTVHGFSVNDSVRKFDGRPFLVEELVRALEKS